MVLFYYDKKERGWVAVKIVKNETPFSVDEVEEHIMQGDYEWLEKNGIVVELLNEKRNDESSEEVIA